MTGNIDDAVAPKSMQNIVKDVMDFVIEHTNGGLTDNDPPPIDFDTYDQALHAVWPDLYKADSKAAILVAISIWIEIGERWGFEVSPEEVKALRL
jgi:hypothetical protein